MNNVIIFKDNLKRYKNIYSPALFLDRDGVIIKEQHYISDPDKVCLEDGVVNIINNAFNSYWKVVVVTNQSGISRGLLDWDKYDKITNRMLHLLGSPIKITGIYSNDVIFDENCETWRKPSPKMLLEASKDLKIDLKKSILIGDRYTDLLAGARAGLRILYHVSTGHGNLERSSIESNLNSKDELNDFSKVNFIDSLLDLDISIFKKIVNEY